MWLSSLLLFLRLIQCWVFPLGSTSVAGSHPISPIFRLFVLSFVTSSYPFVSILIERE
ncbi:hypothetical protein LINPERPRIM_LOCUS14336 [Linum perenne]